MVLGAYVVLCMTKPNFLKKMFYPQNGENRPSPGFFECIYRKVQVFVLVLYFFISVVYDEKFITVILVCLNKFYIWENYGF